MRRFIAWTLTLAAGASSVSIALGQAPRQATQKAATSAATPATKAANAPAAAPLDPAAQKAKLAADTKAREEMNLLLTEWERQSSQVKTLMVVFDRTDHSLKWGDQVYQGQAFLKSPDLACLEFKKAVPDASGKPKFTNSPSGTPTLVVEKEPFERIVCTGKDVLQYEWDVKEIFIYPLDKEARQKALQQGPLPFLFNMKAAEAKKRYDMKLLETNETTYKIAINPKEQIDQKSFKTAYVLLNRKNFLPSKLYLFPVGDKERQDFIFNVISPNQPIDDRYFHPAVNLAGWKINRNPGDEAKPQGADGAAMVTPATAAPGRPVQAAPKRATQPPPRSASKL